MAIPGTDGVIHGAYPMNGGNVLALDIEAGETLPPGYRALDWNPLLSKIATDLRYVGGSVIVPRPATPDNPLASFFPNGLRISTVIPAPNSAGGEVVISGGPDGVFSSVGSVAVLMMSCNPQSHGLFMSLYLPDPPASVSEFQVSYMLLCGVLTA